MEKKELDYKLQQLEKLLLGLNAFGSLDLKDLELIRAFLIGAFNYKELD